MTNPPLRTMTLPKALVRQDKIDAVLEELRRSLPDADDADRIYTARRLVEILRPDLFD
jgi:hypothetical protein